MDCGKSRNQQMRSQACGGLLHPDVRLLDNRPPLRDFAALGGADGCARLLVARKKLTPELRKSLAHHRIVQGMHYRSIEPRDHLSWCPLGRPKRLPERGVKSWQSRLIDGRYV